MVLKSGLIYAGNCIIKYPYSFLKKSSKLIEYFENRDFVKVHDCGFYDLV